MQNPEEKQQVAQQRLLIMSKQTNLVVKNHGMTTRNEVLKWFAYVYCIDHTTHWIKIEGKEMKNASLSIVLVQLDVRQNNYELADVKNYVVLYKITLIKYI